MISILISILYTFIFSGGLRPSAPAPGRRIFHMICLFSLRSTRAAGAAGPPRGARWPRHPRCSPGRGPAAPGNAAAPRGGRRSREGSRQGRASRRAGSAAAPRPAPPGPPVHEAQLDRARRRERAVEPLHVLCLRGEHLEHQPNRAGDGADPERKLRPVLWTVPRHACRTQDRARTRFKETPLSA